MKRKGFPHVAKQTHEVFHPTSLSSKKWIKRKCLFRDET